MSDDQVQSSLCQWVLTGPIRLLLLLPRVAGVRMLDQGVGPSLNPGQGPPRGSPLPGPVCGCRSVHIDLGPYPACVRAQGQ